jgi:hypothetical protein
MNAQVCKHLGDGDWLCRQDSYTDSTVTLEGIEGGFSDWAVGDSMVTAVGLTALAANPASFVWLWLLVVLAVGAAWVVLRSRRQL